jgi:hypothetical protein
MTITITAFDGEHGGQDWQDTVAPLRVHSGRPGPEFLIVDRYSSIHARISSSVAPRHSPLVES